MCGLKSKAGFKFTPFPPLLAGTKKRTNFLDILKNIDNVLSSIKSGKIASVVSTRAHLWQDKEKKKKRRKRKKNR